MIYIKIIKKLEEKIVSNLNLLPLNAQKHRIHKYTDLYTHIQISTHMYAHTEHTHTTF